MEIEIDELFGLPAHPLLVHIPVVLIPTALVALLIALWPAARRPALIGAALMAVVGAAGAVLAVGAGEKLQDRVKETEQVEEHVEQGEDVELPAIAFAVVAVGAALAVEAAHRRSQLRPEPIGPATPRGSAARDATPVGEGGGPGGATPTASGAVATEVRAPTDDSPSLEATPSRPVASWLPAALLAAALVVGAYSTYTVIEAGHSGAKATWHDTPAVRDGGDGDADGD
jgi:hypothetical protein